MGGKDHGALPFPTAAGYGMLALNGAKGGATKYLTLQYLNYARWTAQQHSCSMIEALRIMGRTHLISVDGTWTPLGFAKYWRPAVTLLNETVHWGMKVPAAMLLFEQFRDLGFGPHGGLFTAVALSTAGEVAATGWSERFGVHMGLQQQISSYRESFSISRQARQGILAGAWAGAAGLWVRNFSWNFAFFEWKRFLHNAVDNSPANAPAWFEAHLDWLRSLEKKNQANVLTFEAATLGTYLTFFNMAGDNVKTKMQVDPARYPSFSLTVRDIWHKHGCSCNDCKNWYQHENTVAANGSLLSSMSYAGGASSPSAKRPGSIRTPRDGDSAYVQDSNAVSEAVKKIQSCAADIRKETHLLGSVQLQSSRKKVEEAVHLGKQAVDEGKRHLQKLSCLSGGSISEQRSRVFTQQMLREKLELATTDLEATFQAFEKTAKNRESAQSRSSGGRLNEHVEMGAMPGGAEIGVARQQVQEANLISEGEAEIHVAMVDEYVEQISTIEQDVRGLQQAMVDLATHAKVQSDMLDHIEAHSESSSVATADATAQLTQASRSQRRGSKFVYWLLLLAAVLAVILIFVVVNKSSSGS
ncbi:Stx7 [Symbiodinium necroappetens]|uniref:Stx7 protein n=1 Tax=Symbiodinium necroappetens TaxID=1628268 RepID=A0A813CHD3_9DINO|nr:Stx7 [Symbiodinium necroappetens]